MALINGTSGNDPLNGTAGDDEINGLGGADTIQGGTGVDDIEGGEGDDYINHNTYTNYTADDGAVDLLSGGGGADIIDLGEDDIADGGTGIDRATVYHATATPVTHSLAGMTTTAQVQAWMASTFGVQLTNFEAFGLTGTAGDDVLTTWNRDDSARVTFNGVYNNTLEGFGGNDTLQGGTGHDELYGGDGDDTLRGGGGADLLVGGAGNDLIDGQASPNTEGNYAQFDIVGQTVTIDLNITTAQNTGEGMDTILNIGNVLVRGNSTSSATLIGGNSDGVRNYFQGGQGADILDGRSNNDRLDGRGGADQLIGGDGFDEAYYATAGAAVTVNLATNTGSGSDAQGDTYVSIENIQGSTHNDSLTGDGAGNRIIGFRGDDVINGGGGIDDLRGNDGADVINGGEGNDTLWQADENEASFDTHADTLNGEGGNDNIVIGRGDTADGGLGTDQAFVDFSERTSGINLDLRPGAEAVLEAAQNLTLTNFEFFHVFGSVHDDVIRGTDALITEQLAGDQGNDHLIGGNGFDYLLGMQGDDILDGSGDGYNDNLNGGDGNDTYIVSATGDVIVETGGIDTVQSSATYSLAVNFNLENLVLSGGTAINGTGNAGANVITGNGANNTLTGANGDDTLNGGDGDDVLNGGPGADAINGGAGSDTAVFTGTRASYAITFNAGVYTITGADGSDTVTGVEFAQFSDQTIALAPPGPIVGTAGDDVLNGTAGDDVINGQGGADTLNGLGGDDQLNGAAGNDVQDGGTGNDQLNGGSGDDTLSGGADDDTLSGAAGLDTLNGGDGMDTLQGGDDNDQLSGDAGDDSLNGGAGADALNGGLGVDTATYLGATVAINVNLTTGVGTGGWAQGDTFASVENLFGSNKGDALTGSAVANLLDGAQGDDVLDGAAGDDTLIGNGGHDLLKGGDGHDELIGGTGDDSLQGANGNDVLNGGSGIDLLQGGNNDDTLLGGSENDTLQGGSGNDVLNGGSGSDQLNGGAGNDRFEFGGGWGQDRIADFAAGVGAGDVIAFANTVFSDFASVMAATADDGLGNCVITRGANTLTLTGVTKAQLNTDDFVFNAPASPAAPWQAVFGDDLDPLILPVGLEAGSARDEAPAVCPGETAGDGAALVADIWAARADLAREDVRDVAWLL